MLSLSLFIGLTIIPCITVKLYNPKQNILQIYPIVVLSLITVLFCGGIFFGLKISFWRSVILLLLGPAILIVGGCNREQIKKTFLYSIREVCIILVTFSVFVYCDRGMLAGHTSDDFTHWIYVVREMVRFDDFGTNSSANCMFSSYPPGISVLQFFFIKLHMTVANGIFTEWRVFFAYHLLLASMLYEIYNNCTMDDKVLFIDQEQWLYPYVTINYAVRPVQLDLIDGWPNWNITSDLIDHDSFVDQVMERDFVAIYHRDEYFIEEYSDLFSGQPEDVESFWLYKVDKSQKKLVAVE